MTISVWNLSFGAYFLFWRQYRALRMAGRLSFVCFCPRHMTNRKSNSASKT